MKEKTQFFFEFKTHKELVTEKIQKKKKLKLMNSIMKSFIS